MGAIQFLTEEHDVSLRILAVDGKSWNTLNHFKTENSKVNGLSELKREMARDRLITKAESYKDLWLNVVFPSRVLRVDK